MRAIRPSLLLAVICVAGSARGDAPQNRLGPLPGLRLEGSACVRDLYGPRGLICRAVFIEGPPYCSSVIDASSPECSKPEVLVRLLRDPNSSSPCIVRLGSACSPPGLTSADLGHGIYYFETGGRSFEVACLDASLTGHPPLEEARRKCGDQGQKPPDSPAAKKVEAARKPK